MGSMAATVRTAISMRRDLFRQSDKLARRLRVTRSRLFSMAMEEFLRRYEDKELLARINAANEDFPDAEEKAVLDAMYHEMGRVAARERW
jgi:metal-responsive CopG/Arc/MetJ family transcriptional regulator